MNYKIPFYIVTIVLIIFCILWWRAPDVSSTPDLESDQKASMLRNSYLSTGGLASSAISFIDGKVTMIDNTSGKVVPPCKEGLKFASKEDDYLDSKKSSSKENLFKQKQCGLEIINADSNLLASLEASKSIIEGNILKNGKRIPARFVVQVSAIYEGSIFYNVFAGGVWHIIEISDVSFCPSMSAALFANQSNMSEQEFQSTKSFLENMGCVI